MTLWPFYLLAAMAQILFIVSLTGPMVGRKIFSFKYGEQNVREIFEAEDD